MTISARCSVTCSSVHTPKRTFWCTENSRECECKQCLVCYFEWAPHPCMQEEVSHCAAGTKWLNWLFNHRHLHPAPCGPRGRAPQSAAAVPLGSAAALTAVQPRGTSSSSVEAAREPALQSLPDAGKQSPTPQDLAPDGFETVQGWFQALVRAHFHGKLKGPFNEEARRRAGFDPTWYQGLVVDSGSSSSRRPAACRPVQG